MREFVGNCSSCAKEVYCHDGFLNGLVLDNGHLLCFDCEQKQTSEPQEKSQE